MKEFLIQSIKFEFKRSYINEFMNFLIFFKFFGFYFDFSGFIQSCGTHRDDVAQCRHMAGPRKPTWMPT